MDTPAGARIGRTVLGAVVCALLVGGTVIVAVQPEARVLFQPPTYASTGRDLFILDRSAGLAMLLAGLIAWVGSDRPQVGVLAMLAGFLWLLPDVVGRAAVAREIRAAAAFGAPLLGPVLATLVWQLQPPSRTAATIRAGLASLVLATVVAASAVVLVYDSSVDVTCWARCQDEPILSLRWPALTRSTQVAIPLLAAAAAIGLVIAGSLGLYRWYRTRWRDGQSAISLGAAAFGIGALVVAVPTAIRYLGIRPLGIRVAPENPAIGYYRAAFILQALALCALAVGLAWRVVDERRLAARVRRIASDFEAAPSPGSLQLALAGALGDPTLRVGYWMEHDHRYVDAEGRPAPDPIATGTGSVVTIRRGGQLLAAVATATSLGLPALQSELGSAALTALDNERLRAAVLDRLADLQESRARIVELGDAERQRLERDLHDGAQQRLLAVSYDIRTARAAAVDADRSDLTAILDRAATEIATAVEELRRLAHGVYPAILSESGLSVAIGALGEETPMALELVDDVAERRFPAPVESAVYELATEAASDAARRGANHLRIALHVSEDQLVVELSDDAPEGSAGMVLAADRIWAAGGSLGMGRAEDDVPGLIRARLPCA